MIEACNKVQRRPKCFIGLPFNLTFTILSFFKARLASSCDHTPPLIANYMDCLAVKICCHYSCTTYFCIPLVGRLVLSTPQLFCQFLSPRISLLQF